jgi:o-succinylbenzoate synthase
VSIARVYLAPYSVPLAEPWPSAEGPVTTRNGWLLGLENERGIVGWGESAPWPGFGLESHASSGAALRLCSKFLIGIPSAAYTVAAGDLPRLAPTAACPAARHAIDLALHDLAAREAGVSIARLLGGDDALQVVRANATLPRLVLSLTAERARRAVEMGADTLKLKVGGSPLKDDVARVRVARESVGERVSLRLDANQSWSEAEAVAALTAMRPFGIEYAEQPVKADDPECLARVRRASGVPVAADEGASSIAAIRLILDLEAADVVILKPMVHGGLRAAREVAALARERGIGIVVTSLLEGPIGQAGAVQLAASLGPTGYAHGVGTRLIALEGIRESAPSKPYAIDVPSGSGLGVAVEPVWRRAASLVAEVEA